MEKKKSIKYIVIGILALLIFSFGTSFAYFISRINQEGQGSNVDGSTASNEDTVVSTTGSIGFEDTDIYPGHKNISKVVVTATGDSHVIYNLIWTGTNTLNTTINYKVYKTTTEETPSIICKQETTVENGKIKYKETCEEKLTGLGEIISSGEIKPSEANTTVKLVKNEEIDAASAGVKVYYYIVLEYPNQEDTQNIDMNGSFTGNINVELLEKKDVCGPLCERILGDNGGSEAIKAKGNPDFSKTSCASGTYYPHGQYHPTSVTCGEDTTGLWAMEDDDGISYYFRGSPTNNYVKFGGFYWRIIRINGDGTIRMIYDGTEYHPNGAKNDDSIAVARQKFSHKDAYYNSSTDNAYTYDNAYVGYMYGTPGAKTYDETHANINSSNAKQEVDNWYATHLDKEGIKEYIDANAGFCGDRSKLNGSGIGTSWTAYGVQKRIYSNKTPSLKCPQQNDLYTVSNANKGNKALTYPVGLITLDEVSIAGGVNPETNYGYYLSSGTDYWTISPFVAYNEPQNGFVDSGMPNWTTIAYQGNLRPVINLKSEGLNITLDTNGVYVLS